MNTCDTCKWWDRWPENTCGACFTPAVTSDWPKDSQIMNSDDGDEDGPHLVTGPKFGCIHYEPKTRAMNEYDVITGADLDLVKRAVESAMNSGWSPVGNISAHFDPTNGYVVFMQAIIKTDSCQN